MIDDLDRTLEQMLRLEFGSPLPFDLSYSIPDKNFTPVSTARSTLNCYLYDIREERELRTVEPDYRSAADGGLVRELPPARIRLTYCITAWSPLKETSGTPPALDEHSLLANVVRMLLKYPVLPSELLQGALAAQEPSLPTYVARPESMEQAKEFWNAIGGQLRPAIDWAAVVALTFAPPESGDRVTAVESRFAGDGGAAVYTIGGTVMDNGLPPAPIADTWVRVDQTGMVTATDTSGRFVIPRLAAGSYSLTVRAVGFKEAQKSITIPQPDGSYDVMLTPL